MDALTFVTGNAAKAEQLSHYLDAPVTHRKLDIVEVQSLDLAEIVEHKAKEAYAIVGSPVLVEDTALIFHALGALPGPLIKWFLQELGNEGLCRLLDGYQIREATAHVLFGWYDGTTLKTFNGNTAGSIADTPRGERGFGWDTIFIPDGFTETWAEMAEDQKAESFMRSSALKKLEQELKKRRATP